MKKEILLSKSFSISGEEECILSRNQTRVKKRELELAELSIGTICTRGRPLEITLNPS